MSTRTLTLAFAGGETLRLPGGRFLFIKAATAALDIVLREEGSGAQNQLTGVGAGARYKREASQPAWRFTEVASVSAQTVTLILSDDAEFDVATSVAVTGSVSVADVPSTTVATPVAGSRATGGADSIAANTSRRRITICALSTNTGSLFVQAVGAGAGRGYELQPGTSAEFRTTAALDIRNDSGATQAYMTFEES
jgi:hypothetical protein